MATPKKAQRFDDFREWNHDMQRAFTAHPRYRNGDSSAPTAFLRSSVFALSERTANPHAQVPAYDDLTDTTAGASVSYRGAPLRQADLRVLLGLLGRASGMQHTAAVLEFDACEFLGDIGRATCSRSVAALLDSLASLRSATFTVRNSKGDKGRIFGLIDDVQWNKHKVRVKLSSGVWEATQAGRTYVPMALRRLLADGVQTALADLLQSSDTGRLEYEALAKLWHRADAKEVGREVRSALGRLQEVGLVASWEAGRGVAHVVKAQLH